MRRYSFALWITVAVGAVVWGILQMVWPRTAPMPGGPAEIKILGQVVKPGTFPWKKGMTVRESLYLADGPTQFANTKKALIMNPSMQRPVIHAWREKLHAALRPTEEAVYEGFDSLDLAEWAPTFDWLEPGPFSKAVVNLTTREGLDYELDPQDVVIVREIVISL